MANITVKILVEGGKANAGPPLGPSLAIAKVNIGEVVAAINEKTKEFKGMEVPVTVEVDIKTREFTISVGSPPVSSLIKKELGVEKLSKAAWGEYTPKEGETYEPFEGNLEFDQVVKIARSKFDGMGTLDFKNAVKQVVGTCLSSGVKINEKNPKEILKEIDEGTLKVE